MFNNQIIYSLPPKPLKMICRFVFLLVSSTVLFPLYAQRIQDSTYIKEIKRIGKLSYTNQKKALYKLDSILPLIERRDIPVEKSMVYRQYGTILGKMPNYDQAERYFQTSLNIAKEHSLLVQWNKCMLNYCGYLGNHNDPRADSMYQVLEKDLYFKDYPKEKVAFHINYSGYLKKHNIEQAIDELETAIEIANKEDFHKYDLYIHHLLGNHFHAMRLIERSLEHSKMTLTLLDPDDQRRYSVYNNMASSFVDLEQLDSAKFYLTKVVNGTPKETSLIFTYQNLANIHLKEDNPAQTAKYANLCIDIAKKYNAPNNVCTCELMLAGAYNNSKDFKETNRTLNLMKNCFSESVFQQIQYEELKFGNTLSLIGRNDMALRLKEIISKKDSFSTNVAKKELQELETKYLTAQKEAQNKLLKAERIVQKATINRQKIWMSGLGMGMTGLLFGLFMFGKRSKDRKKHIDDLAAKNHKIEALSRETVHRTKNYLHLATALLNKNKVHTEDPRIAEVLEDNEKRLKVLSKINTQLSAADIKTQLPIKGYISELVDDLEFSFQNTRHGTTKIKSQITDAPIESDKCLYIGLIINELIVNSFKHARPKDEILEINISLDLKDEAIQLSYHDNGQNISQEGKSTSQGTKLIVDLFQQLKGTYEFKYNTGYSFTGSIPLNKI